MKRNRAFSLIELLIVLAILALVASLAVPIVKGNRDKASYEVSVLNLYSVGKAMEKHYLEKGVYPVFNSWSEVASESSPLTEYLNDIPSSDAWNRPYRILNSSETEYEFEGLSIQGKLKKEYPDYTVITGPKLKKKGKKNTT